MNPITYILHIGIGILVGMLLMLIPWSASLSRYNLHHGTYSASRYHRRITRMATLLALLGLLSIYAIPARCQGPGSWHALPPPMNIVNGALLMEHSATTRRDATYVALAGIGAGMVLATQDREVGLAVGTIAIGYSIRLNLRSAKSQRMAAQLWQLGYRAEHLYDIVPDSMDATPHRHVVPK